MASGCPLLKIGIENDVGCLPRVFKVCTLKLNTEARPITAHKALQGLAR